MKHSNTCPKCGSRDILRIKGQSGPYGTGNNIPAGATIFSHILVHRYLCCDCGYSEEWVSKEDIPRLKKKYL